MTTTTTTNICCRCYNFFVKTKTFFSHTFVDFFCVVHLFLLLLLFLLLFLLPLGSVVLLFPFLRFRKRPPPPPPPPPKMLPPIPPLCSSKRGRRWSLPRRSTTTMRMPWYWSPPPPRRWWSSSPPFEWKLTTTFCSASPKQYSPWCFETMRLRLTDFGCARLARFVL